MKLSRKVKKEKEQKYIKFSEKKTTCCYVVWVLVIFLTNLWKKKKIDFNMNEFWCHFLKDKIINSVRFTWIPR